MKIGVDAGGLCTDNRFGNFTFGYNLVRALSLYGGSHQYRLYGFCPKPQLPALANNMVYENLQPKRFWSSLTVGWKEWHDPSDFYLALNQAVPLMAKKKTLAFSHGLSFRHFPDLYNNARGRMERQLKGMRGCRKIIVSSAKVKEELLGIFPKLKNIEPIPFGLPHDMEESLPRKTGDYFLFCGMDHPIKYVDGLVQAFYKAKEEFPSWKGKLYLAGNFERYRKKKDIMVWTKLTRQGLKKLYAEALAYVTVSRYESFNFPVLEALSQGCPVVGTETAVIPEMAKYCRLAKDEDNVVDLMVKLIQKGGYNIDKDRIRNEFSWKSYVDKLVSLF